MNHDLGGWLWLLVTVGFVTVLGVTLFYGMMRYRQRTRGEKQMTEEATRQLYQKEQ